MNQIRAVLIEQGLTVRKSVAALRTQHNKLGVALANKLARIASSVLNSGKDVDWKEKELATAI